MVNTLADADIPQPEEFDAGTEAEVENVKADDVNAEAETTDVEVTTAEVEAEAKETEEPEEEQPTPMSAIEMLKMMSEQKSQDE